MSTTSKSKTMIEGPLAKQILLVSLPLALSNLLQILFNMSDVAVVGRFAGSTALGSVGSTATFVTLFTGFLIGLSNGVNVLVARFYGAGHPKDVSKTVHSAEHQGGSAARCDFVPAGLLSRYAGAGALQLRQRSVQRYR